MSMNTSSWVTGLFMNRGDAERALDALLKAGYRRDNVSIMMTDTALTRHFGSKDTKGNVAQGVGVGSLVGGSIGAVLAGIAAAGTAVAFPGIGLIVAGPIAAALVGAGAGGAAGSLVGAIAGAGIPEDRAKLYEQGLREGGMVLGAKSNSSDQERKLERWLIEAGAEKVSAAL